VMLVVIELADVRTKHLELACQQSNRFLLRAFLLVHRLIFNQTGAGAQPESGSSDPICALSSLFL